MTTLYFFDIGTRGMASQVFASMAENVFLVGFEPDEDECAKLNFQTDATPYKSEHHYPVAFSAWGGVREFYVTRDPACSSLYKPNKAAFQADGLDPDRVDVALVDLIYTRRLQDWCDAKALWPDFIKIDAQGAEAEILAGYDNLEGVLGVQLELLVLPLYMSMSANYMMPMQILDNHGFKPHAIKPTYWIHRGEYRLAWFDALYLNESQMDAPLMRMIKDAYKEWMD
jgi:FkbM family methyltransferase